MQRFYNESKEAALQAVKSSSQGLTQAEARARLERNGKNQLAQGKKDSLLKRFFLQMADPMILILLAAAAISGALAVYENESFTDVIIILFVVVVNAVLGVYQENKAEKAIEALQEMAAATSKVLRDGQMMTVRSEDLVVGDVVLLEAGDAVPADGRILESASLKIEEAALGGVCAGQQVCRPDQPPGGRQGCASGGPEKHGLHGVYRGLWPGLRCHHRHRHGYGNG